MRLPPLIQNETERLQNLSRYRLEGAADDPAIDQIIKLTAQIFDVPTALLSIVGKDKQFFASKIGLDLCETDRKISFCAHALDLDEILVVPDAKIDIRFADNPLVTGAPFIRFYAGIPLRSSDGFTLGTLCIIDTRAKSGLSVIERDQLNTLSKVILDKIEARRIAIESLNSKNRFEKIAATSPDGIICADAEGKITFWNKACETLFGFSEEIAIGAELDLIVPARLRGGHGGGLKRVANGGKAHLIGKIIELAAAHKNGTEFPIELSLSMWEEEGLPSFGAIIRDISARRADEDRMYELAFLDSLTKIPNRRVLMQRVSELQEQKKPFTLLMLDLDGFKNVNDSLGHHAGDQVLKAVARRVIKCVRSIDTVARLGGDEFALLLPDNTEKNSIQKIGEKILEAISETIELNGHAMHVNSSIGAAFAPSHGTTEGEILSAADLAMYQAKSDGRNCLRFFTPRMRETVMNRHTVENEIYKAIEKNEFELFYQPQIKIADNSLVGVEALLRWRHPTKGLLAPAHFLSIIEDGSLAIPVGRWVLHTACEAAVKLRTMIPNLTMGVNLFGAHFRTGELTRDITLTLNNTGLTADALELEITENVILHHDDVILDQLREIRLMGVKIAFDDFGTGYASLSMLKAYPLTRLKIDRSFINAICTDEADAAIVNAMIYMASSLKLDVVAEGVETAEQSDMLKERGCEIVQGYFYGKPMPISDIVKYIRDGLQNLLWPDFS